MNLRTPGPTPCPPEVLEAMGRQMIDHRGPEAAALITRLTAALKRAFQTRHDVLILTTSGTGGLEAAVVNTVSPGERVLSVSIGSFGDRFASIAKTYGAEVTKLTVEPGQAATPDLVAGALAADRPYHAVLVTHNETSTSVTNPLAEIAAAVRSAPGAGDGSPLILVDAVSSLSSIPVAVDDWGLDVVVSGSQKGWMAPPGLAFVSMSSRAWQANARCTTPRFYFDAVKHRDAQEKGQTPWTPALSLFFAMDVALEMLEREGWENVYARHARVAEFTRRGVREMGLELLADPRHASNTVTAARAPKGMDVSAFRKALREDHGVVVAGGQGDLTGKIFRIGHLGLVTEQDLGQALDGIAETLAKLGIQARASV